MSNTEIKSHSAETAAVPKESTKQQIPVKEKAEISLPERNDLSLISKYRGAIMGFAAIWILFFHEWIVLSATEETVIGWTERFIKRTGFCGVDIFLFLSGMGLTYAIKKASLGKFYYNRLKRLLFPFLFVAVIRCLNEGWKLSDFIGNVSGYNFYTKTMYSFLWFVPAITTFYILFPAYNTLFSKSSNKLLFTAGAFELWLLLSLILRDDLRGDLYGFTNRIPIFLIGIYAGWLCQNKKIRFTKTTWIYLFFTMLLGGYLSYLANYKGLYILVPVSNCCIPNMLMAMSLPFLFAKGLDILCTKNCLKIFGNGLNKVLCFFGGFSLEFYCIQEWLSGQLKPKFLEDFAPLTVNLLIFACVTIVALLMYYSGRIIWKMVDRLVFRKPAK